MTWCFPGKVATWKNMVSFHCSNLLEHVIIVRISYFDTDFVSQMKLTKLPSICCFAPMLQTELQDTLKSQINDMENYLIHIAKKILQVTKPVLTTGQQNQSISSESWPEHTILQIHTLVYCFQLAHNHIFTNLCGPDHPTLYLQTGNVICNLGTNGCSCYAAK